MGAGKKKTKQKKQTKQTKFAKFNEIVKAIKQVKIQGAENIAKAAVKALLLRNDSKAIHTLLSLRPTEPCLRNSIKYVLVRQKQTSLKNAVNEVIKHFDNADKAIAEYGARLIKNKYVVFTHCHSQTVVNALIKAKQQGKKFEVWQTETRPLMQGRITAKQLAKAGIKVTHIVDSAARLAIEKADIVLFGCDAITMKHVYNKIGSYMFALIAEHYGVPIYILTNSWKFDVKSLSTGETPIEYRSSSEVWKNKPKQVTIINPAFEKIPLKYITGFVTEFGILTHTDLIRRIKNTYSILF